MAELPGLHLPKNTTTAFLQVEHSIYVALGALLSVVAVVALFHTAADIWHSIMDWQDADSVFPVMDELLFVLMLGEILHTVRVSMRVGSLSAEPFLVVGLIASIRRVLILTFESPKASADQAWTATMQAQFRASMIELGVLALLITVMVVSIMLVRRRGGGPMGEAQESRQA
jgi:uncharacterized membrane protein (DUF373 family)